MTIANILDIVLPYTREEMRCGIKKLAKTRQRTQLSILINHWYEDKQKTTGAPMAADAVGSRKALDR
jgi:hypothetical protein